jgi:hypothetical protein
MSKSNLDLYLKNLILPNKKRINYLRLSNPFTVDIVFSPPRVICQFIQLETLILENIDAKYLRNILKYLIKLPKLQCLVLKPTDYVSTSSLFGSMLSLSKLKSFKLTCRAYYDQQPVAYYFNSSILTPIEYLVLNCRFSIGTLNNLFCCLPKLRYLSIDCLVGSDYTDLYHQRPAAMEYLKTVSIKLDNVHFKLLELLIKCFFKHVEVLHLSTQNDPTYLDAKVWEKVISLLMPNLRIFDIHYNGSALTYHDLISQFNSSFWIQRQWYFTHQHNWQATSEDNGIFYSTNPYRRKDYPFHWELNQQNCSTIPEKNLNSVKHVHLFSRLATDNWANYFPNANELTIERYFPTSDDSISATFNRILPLQQLNKLIINSLNISFEQIIKLIRFTPNLNTFKFNLLSFIGTNFKLIEQSEDFQYVSNTNKITNLELREPCTLDKFQMIMKLFPHVEYLKSGINRKEIHQIIRFLFKKTDHQTHRLLFLCISQVPKVCFSEVNVLIKFDFLKDYSIKYIDRDLYLWW